MRWPLFLLLLLTSLLSAAEPSQPVSASQAAPMSALPSGEDRWSRLERAVMLANDKREAGIEAIEDLLVDEPAFHPAHYNLGNLLLPVDPAKAERHYSSAVETRVPKLASSAWHNMALARYEQGRIEAALEAAEEAVRLEPDGKDLIHTRDELRRLLLERREAARKAAEEAARKLRIITLELPPIWVTEATTATIEAAGGAGGPYRFSAGPESGMPAGLTLAPDGIVSGAPAAGTVGEHEVTVVVSDNADATAEGTVRVIVLPQPAITNPDLQLEEAITRQPYRATITTTGMFPGEWKVEGLPPGLSFTPKGANAVITGTAAADSEGDYVIQASLNDGIHSVSAELTLKVSKESFVPASRELPQATAWRPYHHRLQVRGAPGEYRWEAADTNGIHVDSRGEVSGKPEAAGRFQVPVMIIAEDGRSRDFVLDFTVNAPPVIDEPEPRELTVSKPVQEALTVKHGTAPYTWSSIDQLPAGLELTEQGALVGVPREAGEFTIAVAVDDHWGAHTESTIQLLIQEPPPPSDQSQSGDGERQDQAGEQGEQEPQDGEGGEEGQQGEEPQDGEAGENNPEQGDSAGEQGEEQQGEQEQGEQTGEQGQEQQDGQEPDEAESGEGQQDSENREEGQAGDDGQDQGQNLNMDGEGPDPEAMQEGDAQRLREQDAVRWLDNLPTEQDDAILRRFLQMNPGESSQRGSEQPW